MTKINKILQLWPKNTVATSKWLEENNFSRGIKKQYQDSEWVSSIGRGAIIRVGDIVKWEGALHALQYQLHKEIHVGARSALERRGEAHYTRTNKAPAYLFVKPGVAIENWFKQNWGGQIRIIRTSILNNDIGIQEEEVGEFKIKVSSSERAILEMLCFSPLIFSFKEAANIMEHLNWLRSSEIQRLLENCTSHKGKRLFLFLAEHFNHPWFGKLDLTKVDLGKGKRSLFKGGTYNSKYMITIPSEFEKTDEQTPLF